MTKPTCGPCGETSRHVRPRHEHVGLSPDLAPWVQALCGRCARRHARKRSALEKIAAINNPNPPPPSPFLSPMKKGRR